MEYAALSKRLVEEFPLKLDASESYAGVLVGLVACDGVVTHEEALEVTRALTRCSLFVGLSQTHLRRLLRRLGAVARTRGPEALLEASAPGVPRDLRETAFAWAVELAYADGQVTAREVDYLKRAVVILKVPDAQFAKILEVARIRHSG